MDYFGWTKNLTVDPLHQRPGNLLSYPVHLVLEL
jgi:hypothetical protein